MKNVNLANSITALRILGTFLMMFVDPFTSQFFVIYTIAGVSDVLDGFVARITNTVSNFGARLDSASDLFFYFVMAMKCMPAMIEILPYQIWYATAAVVLIRIISYMLVAIKYHRFSSLHTKLNKITGFAIFLIPYMLKRRYGVAYCITACSISTISSLHEMVVHMLSSEYKGK